MRTLAGHAGKTGSEWRRKGPWLAFLAVLGLCGPAATGAAGDPGVRATVEEPPSGAAASQDGDRKDPLRSPGWHLMEDRWFAGETVRHDARVQVLAPPGAEDPTAVPGLVRVEGIENIERLLVFADLNPIPRVLEMRDMQKGAARPVVGFEFKVQQATPIRAAVQTADGTWYVGGTWVDAAGGGCSAPSIASAEDGWADRLGELRGRSWKRGADGQRTRFSLVHPMDTGLAPGIPLFYVEEIELLGASAERLARVEIEASMAENPHLTVEFARETEVRIRARDNNGNRFSGVVR